MSIALWIVGIVAIFGFAAAGWIVLSPPGDNIDARALGEILASVPAALGIIALGIWLILAAIHWL